MSKLRSCFSVRVIPAAARWPKGGRGRFAGDVIEAYSAGVEPHGMNPRAVKVMQEAGVDISGHRRKHVDELKAVPLDYVVTVCDHANESCPLFPGKTKVVHVGFDDPPRLAKDAKSEEEALGHYRRVRGRNPAFHRAHRRVHPVLKEMTYGLSTPDGPYPLHWKLVPEPDG